MKFFHLLTTMGLAILVTALAAQSHTLGASYQQVVDRYAKASRVLVDGAAALELHDVDYAGLRWGRIDFIFDHSRHLSRLQMTTAAAGYDAVLALASQQLNQTPDSEPSLASDAPSNLQIRVCEDEAGAVTVTYEPYSSSS